MKIIFISDLHLSPETIENNQLFYNLLESWKMTIDQLYILGDFFDYWLGDDDDSEFANEMKAALRNFTQFKPAYFIRGNHDFAVGKLFTKETGVKVLNDCSLIKINDNNILLSHGDIFCTLDTKYQLMKKMLYSPMVFFLEFLRLILPFSLRYKLKSLLETKTIDYHSFVHDGLDSMLFTVVNNDIIKYATLYKANIVIHGHTHKPGEYSVNDVITRFEIPDWVDRKPGGYILLDNSKFYVYIP